MIQGFATEAKARPYSWVGLAVSLIVIPIVAILVSIAAILLAFAIEVLFQSWAWASGRLMEAYQIATAGDVAAYFQIPVLLLSGIDQEFLLDTGFQMLLAFSFAASVFILARFRAGPHWRYLIAWNPWRVSGSAGLFAMLVVLMMAGNTAVSVSYELMFLPPKPPSPFSWPAVSSLVLDVIMVPAMEELIVRGWLYTGLRAKLSAWPTILITSVVFALLHGSLLAFVATLPLGVAAGYLRERTGSVKPAIALHMLHNFLVYPINLALKQI